MNGITLANMFQAEKLDKFLYLQVQVPLPLQPRSNVQDAFLQVQVQKSRIIKVYDKMQDQSYKHEYLNGAIILATDRR